MSKYARLLITSNNGEPQYVTVAELEFFDSIPETTDLATGGTATADSFANASNPPEYAFDDNLTNKWTSDVAVPTVANPRWIQYEFPGDPSIVSYAVVGCIPTQENFALRDWELQVSDDGVEWNTIDSRQNETSWTGGEKRYYVVNNQSISGTTLINGAPAECTVRAYRRDTGKLSGDVQSDSITGDYTIPFLLAAVEYDLLCFDGVGICPQASGPFLPTGGGFVYPYTLDLRFNEANGETTFIDSSPYARTVTTQGAAVASDAQAQSGSTSLLLGGVSADYLTVPHEASRFSTQTDFTIEAWIYRLTDDTRDVIASKYTTFATDGFTFQIRDDDLLTFSIGSGTYQELQSTSTLPANQWIHVAATKEGNTLRVFINGILEGTHTLTGTPLENTNVLNIGRDSIATDRNFHGHIDDFKWTQGHARYTTNFTPS